MKIPSLITVFLLMLMVSCKEQNRGQLTEGQSKEAVIKVNLDIFVNAFLNNKDESQLDSIVMENYVRKMNNVTVATNREELKASMNVFFTGFPDLQLVNPDRYIFENDAFVYWTFTGTNTGVFGEVPATGKKAKVSGLSHLHFNDDGKLLSEDVYYNELELLQQLGYVLAAPNLE